MSTYRHMWEPVRFCLHTGLVIGVILQLSSSQLMHMQIPHANLFFVMHLVSGIATFCCASAYVLYRLLMSGQTLLPLFPWAQSTGLRAIGHDIQILRRLRFPVRESGGLAGCVQVLGILLILTMVLLGAVWAIVWGVCVADV